MAAIEKSKYSGSDETRIDDMKDNGLYNQESQMKKDKTRATSNFAKSRHRILMLVNDNDLPSHRVIDEACQKLDDNMETSDGGFGSAIGLV